MGGKTSFFVTGANCKLKVNGVTMAYATDLSYSVSIAHQSIQVLGLYEADTQEPLAYNINGTFTLIRYVEGMKSKGKDGVWISAMPPCPTGANDRGNGVGSFTNNDAIGNTVGNFSNEGRAHQSLDPSKLSQSTAFDIELYQKVSGAQRSGTAVGDFLQGRQAGFTRGSNSGSLGISRLRDCKITGVVTNVNKRGLMTQTFSFVANYLDEDSFLSSSSGVGQQYT
jgi:hypothetical protein